LVFGCDVGATDDSSVLLLVSVPDPKPTPVQITLIVTHSTGSSIHTRRGLALFPGSCAGEEEREPGTHCLHMCQVSLVTCILLD